jgi:hypothetical protein
LLYICNIYFSDFFTILDNLELLEDLQSSLITLTL